jgi:hypothetical protein
VRVEKKEPRRYCLLALDGAFKETALGLACGGLASNGRNLNTSLFPEHVGVKENRKILLCKTRGGQASDFGGLGPAFWRQRGPRKLAGLVDGDVLYMGNIGFRPGRLGSD